MKPINLNQARRAREKAKKKAKADENAVRFGQSKADRSLSNARQKLARDRLDSHKTEEN